MPTWLAMAPTWCHSDAMELGPYIDTVRRELAITAEAGGREAREVAERLTAPLESALRLALLDVLSAAAAEITRDMAPGSVDLRLRGREPSFVVTPSPTDHPFDEPVGTGAGTPQPTPSESEDGAMARINLRLTEDLKSRVEVAAHQAGLSVNAWLVRAAAAGVSSDDRGRHPDRRAARGGERFTGWVH